MLEILKKIATEKKETETVKWGKKLDNNGEVHRDSSDWFWLFMGFFKFTLLSAKVRFFQSFFKFGTMTSTSINVPWLQSLNISTPITEQKLKETELFVFRDVF